MIQVFLVKRFKRKNQRNGKREYRWALRWEEPGGWRCESTGTADRTQAEALQKQKWAELNIPEARPEEPAPEPVKASWDECKEALKRAMEADNLRPSYVHDSVWMLGVFRRMFPEAKTPADVTPAMANEYKRRRAEAEVSPWSIKGDLATLKAVFGKWLGQECGLLMSNPFVNVKPPKCDDPDVRIVTAEESAALFKWFGDRWNNWRLPLVYLEVAALLGWRATETASLREEDLLADGFVRVAAENCKTRRHKYGWLPPKLYADVQACAASGWAFGRFSDELRRLLILWKRRPHHARKVRDFSPERFVGWLQDELKRFNDDREGDSFTLHDFRRTAITGLQMAGASEKETSLMVGATPEVIRKHYEKLDRMAIAKRCVLRRLQADGSDKAADPTAPTLARLLRAEEKSALDGNENLPQTIGA
jgi:integrase